MNTGCLVINCSFSSEFSGVTRSLTVRFDNIKSQYQLELMPLAQQRETLSREIADLRAMRDAFLEETKEGTFFVYWSRQSQICGISAMFMAV